MIENKEKHGFYLISEEFIDEINSTVRIMEHEKSGAKLMHIGNDDDNKTFSIAFKTPPENDTGLPHILEHAVLCGSRKYPVKEPFIELAKGSLNTYLNAMTYADKTVYPISSQNHKDFVNLMDVYLDAVFFPNIYDNPLILKQEGWNYKLANKEDDIEYQGVVYNEMKGAFSSPEGLLYRRIKKSLFPDTTYGFESGGDPDFIPDLTQEEFIAFHKKYYHPSNSYICLYGDGDIDEHLKIINEDYLSHFDRVDIDSDIKIQEPFTSYKEFHCTYPISEEEDTSDKTYLSLNFVIENRESKEDILAIEILQDLLIDSPAAPLKKALIDAGIGQDIYSTFNTSLRQPILTIVAKNSSLARKEEFYRIIMETLDELIEKGINKKLIEGAINSREFELREADFGGYSKGILYATESLKTWIHGGNPTAYLKYEKELEKLKTALYTNYLEDVISKNIINNNHSSLIVMEPEPGLTKRKEDIISKELQELKLSLSDNELGELIESTHKLQKMQTEPDNKEDLEKIPVLSLDDIDRNIKFIDYKVENFNNIPFIFTPQSTNKIAYINIYYDIRGIREELIPYIGLISGLLGKIHTENYSYEELSNLIDISTGGINYSTIVLQDHMNDSEYIPFFTLGSRVLYNNLPELMNLIEEIMLKTKFNQTKRILEVIREIKSRIEMFISNNGHNIAVGRLTSFFSPKGYYDELVKGLSFYNFLCQLEKNYNEMENEIIKNLEEAYSILNNQKRVTIGITSESGEFKTIKKSLVDLMDKMDISNYNKTNPKFELTNRSEGLLAPFNVQYVAKGYNFKKLGYEYSGSMKVLQSILSLDYLWNNVRIQNGAYGCFTGFQRNGLMFFASYRDPMVKETIDIYNESYNYIKTFAVDDRDMLKYIIGTISKLDFPLNPAMQGVKSEKLHIMGITKEMLQKDRNEILDTNQETIRSLAPLVYDCMSKNYLCALGNYNKILEHKDLFDNTVEVFQ